MSAVDSRLQQLLFFWMVPIGIAALIYVLIGKFGKSLQDRFFSAFWNKMMVEYHETMRDMKGEHFNSMKYHKSANADLRNRGLLRILEIGAGSGGNFEFFPPNSRLSVVEPNAFFEPMFYERQSKYPSLKMERFVLGKAEDMKDIEDGSMDIVVSTLVMCSVQSVEKSLKEIQRVLAPGGKYYYWEHVHDVPGTWLHTLQIILTPLWTIWADNCHLNRNTDAIIANDKGFSLVEQNRFDIPLKKGLWKVVKVHTRGVATK